MSIIEVYDYSTRIGKSLIERLYKKPEEMLADYTSERFNDCGDNFGVN